MIVGCRERHVEVLGGKVVVTVTRLRVEKSYEMTLEESFCMCVSTRSCLVSRQMSS